MVLEPANPFAKVIATGKVRLLPDVVTVPPLPDTVHWLLDSVTLAPGVIEPETSPVAPSLNRDRLLLAWM